MRGLVLDHARERHAQKCRGLIRAYFARHWSGENAVDDRELVQASEALEELVKAEPALAEVVDLKFFCGFSFAEIAAVKDISERTAQRNWEKARIYLHRKIRPDLSLGGVHVHPSPRSLAGVKPISGPGARHDRR
jgi:DNA-directed RNA polymerase specialized sigma24 family protein